MRNIVVAHMYAVLVVGTFLGLIPWGVIALLGYGNLGLGTAAVVAGVALAVGGAALSYSCMIVFVWRGRGTAFPTDPPKTFVAVGPYRYVRNPMYIGNLILGLGVGLALQSATYLGYVVVLAVACHLYIVLSEEPGLRVRFGDSYREYCSRIHRWLPGRPFVVALPAPGQAAPGTT